MTSSRSIQMSIATSTKPKATVSIELLDFDPGVWLPGTVCFNMLSFTEKTWIKIRCPGARVSNSWIIVDDIIYLKDIGNLRQEESRANMSPVWNDKGMSYCKNSPASLPQSLISWVFNVAYDYIHQKFRRVNLESHVGRTCMTLHPELSIAEAFNLRTISIFSQLRRGRAIVRLSMLILNVSATAMNWEKSQNL